MSKLFPRISIIIPTYKRPKMICKAVKNCLAQTYPNKEIIVVDDNGVKTDFQLKTQGNLQKYIDDGMVIYYPLKKNSGACNARNYGIGKSCGKYIAFFDDDDEWTFDKIEKQYEVFANSGNNLGLVVCSQKVVNSSTNKVIATTNYKTLEQNTYKTLLNTNMVFATPNALYIRTALLSVDGFTENLKSSQDLDLSLKITKRYSLKYIMKICHIVKIHEGERISTNHKGKISGFKYIRYYSAGLID